MKKLGTFKMLSLVAFSLLTFGVATAQEEGLVPATSLPASSQSFIKENFGMNNIVSVWQDTERGRVEDYTALFADGTEVEFRADGDWKEIKSRNGAVSAKVIPNKINKYLQKHYSKALVKEIQKKRNKYEVKLSNGLELDFSKDGRFLKLDD